GQTVQPVDEVKNLRVAAGDRHRQLDLGGTASGSRTCYRRATPRRGRGRGGGGGNGDEVDSGAVGGIVAVEDELGQARVVRHCSTEPLQLGALDGFGTWRGLEPAGLGREGLQLTGGRGGRLRSVPR